MGLLLQKTNIIRDFLEDHIDGRLFWPREIWSQYAEDPEVFRSPEHRDKVSKRLHLIEYTILFIHNCRH
jgi:farnesyl-diphosphate farnesyltransferase